jgi:hypothetical protein
MIFKNFKIVDKSDARHLDVKSIFGQVDQPALRTPVSRRAAGHAEAARDELLERSWALSTTAIVDSTALR